MSRARRTSLPLSVMVNAVGKDMALVKTAMMSATVTFLYFVRSVAIAIHRHDFHIPGGRAWTLNQREKPTLKVKAYPIGTLPAIDCPSAE